MANRTRWGWVGLSVALVVLPLGHAWSAGRETVGRVELENRSDLLLFSPSLGTTPKELENLDLSENSCKSDPVAPVESILGGAIDTQAGGRAALDEFCRGGCLPLPCGSFGIRKITVTNVTGGYQQGGNQGCGILFGLASWTEIAEMTAKAIKDKIGERKVGCLKSLTTSQACECANKVRKEFQFTLKQARFIFTLPDARTCKFWLRADWTVSGFSEVGSCSAPALDQQ